MTTKRKNSKVKENAGLRFIQNVVEKENCIIQLIDLENDQGNDCYIEFITDEVATSFCVFAQIKSGKSYKSKSGYFIPADKDHLAYWNNHTNPVAGIVYDEESQNAFWVNISEYLNYNTHVLSQSSHRIKISNSNRLTNFRNFKEHFLNFISEYKSLENFGRSLDNFSKLETPHTCYDGFKSLYSNHRNKLSTWFYLISAFGKIKEKGIQGNILGVISNYVPSDDIFWTENNKEFFYKDNIKIYLSGLLTDYFGTKEIEIAIEFLRDGVDKGTFSYRIYKVLSLVHNIEEKLLTITFKEPDPERRSFDFWLFIHFSQWNSIDFTLSKIKEYQQHFPEGDPDGIIQGFKDSLLKGDLIRIG